MIDPASRSVTPHGGKNTKQAIYERHQRDHQGLGVNALTSVQTIGQQAEGAALAEKYVVSFACECVWSRHNFGGFVLPLTMTLVNMLQVGLPLHGVVGAVWPQR